MSSKRRSSSGGVFEVARSRDTVYIRVVGLGSMTNSPTFQGFADQMRKRGYVQFVCDLSACRGVDSTFMGLLVGLHSDARELVIVNADDHCRQQLRSVGLDHILTIDSTPARLPRGVALCELPNDACSPVDRLRLIRKAHQRLIHVDERNEEKFGAFLRGLCGQLGDDDSRDGDG